jgi:hypothetical protein
MPKAQVYHDAAFEPQPSGGAGTADFSLNTFKENILCDLFPMEEPEFSVQSRGCCVPVVQNI